MKQHTKPCSTCPFRRDCTPGELGGSPVETFIGQAFGAFLIPCHECIDYTDPDWKTNCVKVNQCAGVSIYRSNCDPMDRPGALLRLPPDKELVFATPAEFMAHHHGISVREATERLYRYSPQRHWLTEMLRSGARLITKEEFA